MNIDRLIGYLEYHGVDASAQGDKIVVRDVWTKDGERGEALRMIPATVAAVREFLGY